jgi:hypothetical protein
MSIEILDQVLAIYRDPTRVAEVRDRPLPEPMVPVIKVAAGDAGLAGEWAEASGAAPEDVTEACVFFLQQILFAPGADAYRVLGASADAPQARLREHYGLLMRWLHPDRNSDDGWEQVYADRVNQAWQELKTPARRAEYDGRAAEALPVVAAAAVPSARRPVPAGRMAPASGPVLSGGVVRRLPAITLGALGLFAAAVVGVMYWAKHNDEQALAAREQAGEVSAPAAATPVAAAGPQVVADEDPVATESLGSLVDPGRTNALVATPAPAPSAEPAIPEPEPGPVVAQVAAPEPAPMVAREPVAEPAPTPAPVVALQSPAQTQAQAPAPPPSRPPPAQAATPAAVAAATAPAVAPSESKPAVAASPAPPTAALATPAPPPPRPAVASAPAPPPAPAPIAAPPVPPAQPVVAAALTAPKPANPVAAAPPSPRPQTRPAIQAPPAPAQSAVAAAVPAAAPPAPATETKPAPDVQAEPEPVAVAAIASPRAREPAPAQMAEALPAHRAEAVLMELVAAYSAGDGRRFDRLFSDPGALAAMLTLRERLRSSDMRFLQLGPSSWSLAPGQASVRVSYKDTWVPKGQRRAQSQSGTLELRVALVGDEALIAAADMSGAAP